MPVTVARDGERDVERAAQGKLIIPSRSAIALPCPNPTKHPPLRRHLCDESINGWISSHFCTLLVAGMLVIAACCLAWQWLFLRSISRVSPGRASRFCSVHPALCLRNRYYGSLLRCCPHAWTASVVYFLGCPHQKRVLLLTLLCHRSSQL